MNLINYVEHDIQNITFNDSHWHIQARKDFAPVKVSIDISRY